MCLWIEQPCRDSGCKKWKCWCYSIRLLWKDSNFYLTVDMATVWIYKQLIGALILHVKQNREERSCCFVKRGAQKHAYVVEKHISDLYCMVAMETVWHCVRRICESWCSVQFCSRLVWTVKIISVMEPEWRKIDRSENKSSVSSCTDTNTKLDNLYYVYVLKTKCVCVGEGKRNRRRLWHLQHCLFAFKCFV